MDRSSSTTVARFIRRFRDSEPLSREDRRKQREALEGDIWWTRPPEGNVFASIPAQKSRTEVLEKRKPPEQEEPAHLSDPHPEDRDIGQEHLGHESESDDPKDGLQTAKLTPLSVASSTSHASPSGYPTRSTRPTQISESDQEALGLANGISGVKPAATVVGTDDDGWSNRDREVSSENSVTAATNSARVYPDLYEREGDELASLDARARILLEDCRRVLAPSSSASDKALPNEGFISAEEDSRVHACEDLHGSRSIEGLEERAWMLLSNRQKRDVHPSNLLAESLEQRSSFVRLPCAREPLLDEDCGEVRKLTTQDNAFWDLAGGCLPEGANTYPFREVLRCERDSTAGIRISDNVSLDFPLEKPSVRKGSLLDGHSGSVISAMPSTSDGARGVRSVAVASAAEAAYFRKDALLSALLRRFAEIESELEKRCSARHQDKPKDDEETSSRTEKTDRRRYVF